MAAAKDRLGQLLTLAATRQWQPLARELSALACDWPADYPQAMRTPALALFEWSLRECDEATRVEIARHMGGHPELPLRLLNELYLAAPSPLKREILTRNQLEGEDDASVAPTDAAALIAAARGGAGDFAGALSAVAAIPRDIAEAVLADASGEPLAVLCRGLGLERATFSAVALLHGAKSLPLEVYDTVPDRAARRLAQHWRAHHVVHPRHAQAAE